IYIDDLAELAKRVIKMFKRINFYCYLRPGNTNISMKDKSSILKEYLLEKMPWAYEIYKDLLREGHVFLVESNRDYGAAFLMPTIDEYYMTLDRHSPNDLSDIETTIHELVHIFVAKLAYAYSWENHHNIISGFSKESASLYSSLSFFDFCMKHHICTDDALLNRNMADYDILTFFKYINYFYEMGVKGKKEVIISEGIEYKFDQAYKMEEDEGVAFFRYFEDECAEESFNTYLYGTGAVEAYELLRKEREGYDPQRVLNEFVLKYQRQDVNPDLFKTNLDFMAKEIKGNQKNLEKKYPFPGYYVLK
ncbi:MAG: hypothetical protein K2L98_02670, partial [Bacilli bacterium]|nr:hypothetical protein [Bacilli bacterium]